MKFVRVYWAAALLALVFIASSSVTAVPESVVGEQLEGSREVQREGEREGVVRLLRELRASLAAVIDSLEESSASPSPQLLVREDTENSACDAMEDTLTHTDCTADSLSRTEDDTTCSDDNDNERIPPSYARSPSTPSPSPIAAEKERFRTKYRSLSLCALAAPPIAKCARILQPAGHRLVQVSAGVARALSRLLPASLRERLSRELIRVNRTVAVSLLAVLQLTALPLLSLLGETLTATGGVLQEVVKGTEEALLKAAK